MMNNTTRDTQGFARNRHLPPLTPHALARYWPALPAADYAKLVESIRAQGQLIPILLYEDAVLDGWHRYKACREIGLSPWVEEFQGTRPEAVQRVLALNNHRRHLSATERVEVVRLMVRAVPASVGRPKKLGSEYPIFTRNRIAELAGVSVESVKVSDREREYIVHPKTGEIRCERKIKPKTQRKNGQPDLYPARIAKQDRLGTLYAALKYSNQRDDDVNRLEIENKALRHKLAVYKAAERGDIVELLNKFDDAQHWQHTLKQKWTAITTEQETLHEALRSHRRWQKTCICGAAEHVKDHAELHTNGAS